MIYYTPESPRWANTREMENNMATRTGKHKKGNVRMGIYVEPFRKAIALLTAERLGMTMTDLIWHGIEATAREAGILNAEGKVTKEYEDQLRVATAIVRQSEVNG